MGDLNTVVINKKNEVCLFKIINKIYLYCSDSIQSDFILARGI